MQKTNWLHRFVYARYVMTPKDIGRFLEGLGYQIESSHGSHFKYSKPGQWCKPIVPAHGNHPLDQGTLHKIIRCVGLTTPEFYQQVGT